MKSKWLFGGLGCVLPVLTLLLFTEQQARAYADPGSGALLWQIVVSGALGGFFYMHRYIRRVKDWLRNNRNAKD